jgi:signal transduction histidine kinase
VARQQQKLESIGTLASGVAHEINNPLNVILNYAEILRDTPADGPLAKEYLDSILREGERVAVIVRNLLAFSRKEREHLVPARVADIVERTLSLTRTFFLKDRIQVLLQIRPDLPPVTCRPNAIQQVLMNLLMNARDAIRGRVDGPPEEGTIRIAGTLEMADGSRVVRLTVEDDGGGIPPHVAPRVFDPFFTTRPREQRAGLGLSIAYGIAREHGGNLWFSTEPGRGTRFHLDLPAPL